MKIEVNQWWNKEVDFKLNWYSKKTNFKSSLPNYHDEIEISSIRTFFKLLDPWFDKMDSDPNFRLAIINLNNRWTAIQNNYKLFKEYANEKEIEIKELKQRWSNFSNYWEFQNVYAYGQSQYSYFVLPETIIWEQLISTKFINWQEIYGFIIYFTNANIDNDKDRISGYIKAKKINEKINVLNLNEILKKSIEDQKREKIDLIKTVDEISDKYNERTQKFNDEFTEIKKELNNEKNKLMLSGPIEMWYKRLEGYTGIKYTPSDISTPNSGNKYEYTKKHEKWHHKIWKGKIMKYMLLSVIWALFGIVLTGIIFWWIINELPDQLSDHTRITIIISAAGPFALFFYAYILRIFIKNWNTSRHIAEEIEERISLVQMYIALNQDGEVEHKKSALNEIFKRINTGMIKENENPKNLVEYILKRG